MAWRRLWVPKRQSGGEHPKAEGPGTGDSAYLAKELGVALQNALCEIVQLRPQDPIEFLALWLKKHAADLAMRQEEEEERKKVHQERMAAEREKMRQEELRHEAQHMRSEEERRKLLFLRRSQEIDEIYRREEEERLQREEEERLRKEREEEEERERRERGSESQNGEHHEANGAETLEQDKDGNRAIEDHGLSEGEGVHLGNHMQGHLVEAEGSDDTKTDGDQTERDIVNKEDISSTHMPNAITETDDKDTEGEVDKLSNAPVAKKNSEMREAHVYLDSGLRDNAEGEVNTSEKGGQGGVGVEEGGQGGVGGEEGGAAFAEDAEIVMDLDNVSDADSDDLPTLKDDAGLYPIPE